ncbi:MAG TPA: ATP-binding cassette domain-containing protein [Gemmatimonadaceae bacterium]|nr:ATP-binding cassette domain-containing protein [Gemmatimonadaceae bacterium]
MLSPALLADSVVKHYPGGASAALGGVSLAAGDGECVALVGESGAGKTTLLRCFNRLVEPDAGRVLVGGAEVRAVDAVGLRRRTGYVPQEGGLLPHWTVLRNAALVPWLLGGEMRRDATALAGEALALVGLDAAEFGGRYPRQLSGGQRQRVAMARALAARPAVLLLDEPFGALDAITRAELQEMFLAVRRARPLACLLVTHDLREAARLADRIAVMRAGRVEQDAPVDDVLRRPATPYVARLVAMSGVGPRSASDELAAEERG